jgi:acyl-CoA oxidase
LFWSLIAELKTKQEGFCPSPPTLQSSSFSSLPIAIMRDHSISALWKREFHEIISDLYDNLSSRRAEESVRFVLGSGLLALDDIQKEPEKFFLAHRILAEKSHRIGPIFWLRFTLHYNLFAGSIIALGSPQQVKQFLLRNEIRPSLGCFALTEQRVGDQSGFLLDTMAELCQDEMSFLLHTPYDTAAKTWISQGLAADEAIVFANMIVHNFSYGPQAFLIRLRDDKTGNLLPGITMLDMGPRPEAAGRDLDNARITFDRVRIPLSSHLCRFLQIQNGTVRHPLGRQIRTMDLIGQCLYTGRVTAAQGALQYTKAKLQRVSDNMGSKTCWTPLVTNNRRRANGKVSPHSAPRNGLSKGFLSYAFATLESLERFAAKVEAELCECLLQGVTPKESLQHAIAVLKVEAVETCIDICGSLQDDSGRGLPPIGIYNGDDFLQCCRFAEGDSQTLMQKMARDLARTGGEGSSWQVKAALEELKQEMIQIQMGSGCTAVQAWDQCADHVYGLAEAHMESVLVSYGCLLGDES